MQITRNSLETAQGPGDWFTGTVFIDTVATPTEPSRLGAALVHFTPVVDSETMRDFLSLLSRTLTPRDHVQTEKISDLPRRLSITDAPEGVDPDVGDIAYYAPRGNLAIFYRDFGYSTRLVKLGSIGAGADDR
jgi:hypothetical protein